VITAQFFEFYSPQRNTRSVILQFEVIVLEFQ
jgi:hypothetical protein